MKKTIIIIITLAVIGVITVFFFSGNGEDIEYITAKAEKSSILQTVSETGTIKATKEIQLSFQNSGELVDLVSKVGNKVVVGQVLAKLDTSDLDIRLKEVGASLNYAKANLNKLLSGAAKEDIAVSQASENQAKTSYESAIKELEKTRISVAEDIDQAEKTLNDLLDTTDSTLTTYEQSMSSAETTLANAKSTYQRAIDNKIDAALVDVQAEIASMITALDFVNSLLEDDDADGHLSVLDESHLNNTVLNHKSAKTLIDAAEEKLSFALSVKSNENVIACLDATLSVISKTLMTLNYCFAALENSIDSSAFSQTQIDAYKSTINTQNGLISAGQSSVQVSKQNLNDAILNYNTNVSSAEQSSLSAQAAYDNAVINARNALSSVRINGDSRILTGETKMSTALQSWNVAKTQLQKTQAPARSQDVALAQAQVAQAQSSVESVMNQISKSIINSPIEGTVTDIAYEIGEQVPLGQKMISVLGEDNYEIEVDISEADIAKIKQSNPAVITLDSYGDEVKFYGSVIFIEPAETVIQDVIYYKVKINFVPEGYSVKSGMTANITITTAQKDDVITIPSRAIIERNGDGKFTRKLVNGQSEEVKISTGLRGDEGVTEIIAGVNAGDTIITSIKEKK